MHAALLVTGEDHANVFLVEEDVEDLEHHAAGVAEHHVHFLPLQTLNEDFCTGQYFV